jgi:hypothetical protein
MSITRQVTVWCDICGIWQKAPGTAQKLRSKLKQLGWIQQGKKDFCPDCAPKKHPACFTS